MASTYGFHTTGTEVALNNASNIQGKTILTTGVSPSTLGSAFVETIAKYKPRLLILAARNAKSLASTASSLSAAHPDVLVRLLELDLNSQASVRRAAQEVNAYEEHIDVLVLNAGVMAIPYATTEDGVERQFGVNHLGHFLFANLMIGKLLDGASPGRVVVVSSDGYRLGHVRFEDLMFDKGKSYHPWRAYGQSKTANMLFALSLASKLGKRGLISLSIHPGASGATQLGKHLDSDLAGLLQFDKALGTKFGFMTWETFPFKTIDENIATHIYAAFDSKLTAQHNGAYLTDCNVVPAEEVWCWGRDTVDAEKLWKISENLVGQKFDY